MQNRTPTPKRPRAFAPVPRKCKRHDGWTPARQAAFIDALADTGSVSLACKAVNMASVGAYHLRRQPGAEDFAAAWEEALDHGIAILRDAVMERAIHGIDVPVMSFGKQVGTRRIYNDRLAAFVLRNYDGRMSAGASGVPLRHRKMVEEAVAKARAQWEADRARDADATAAHVRAQMDEVRRRILGGTE
jgi:hypothetical protein